MRHKPQRCHERERCFLHLYAQPNKVKIGAITRVQRFSQKKGNKRRARARVHGQNVGYVTLALSSRSQRSETKGDAKMLKCVRSSSRSETIVVKSIDRLLVRENSRYPAVDSCNVSFRAQSQSRVQQFRCIYS